jgi:hypothetical protein
MYAFCNNGYLNWKEGVEENMGDASGNDHNIRGVGELGRVGGEHDATSGPDFELLPNFQVMK